MNNITTLAEFYEWRKNCPICSVNLVEKLYIDPNFIDEDISVIKILLSGAVGDNLNKLGLAILKLSYNYDNFIYPKFVELILECKTHYCNVVAFLSAGSVYDISEEFVLNGLVIENNLTNNSSKLYTFDGEINIPLMEKSFYDSKDNLESILLFI